MDINLYDVVILLRSISIIWQRNLKDIAELYGCENSLQAIEEFRRVNGLESISSTCFKAAKISAILIDDGIKFDKQHDIEWLKAFVPFIGRILRVEHLAETILDEVRYFEGLSCFYSLCWYLSRFEFFFWVF